MKISVEVVKQPRRKGGRALQAKLADPRSRRPGGLPWPAARPSLCPSSSGRTTGPSGAVVYQVRRRDSPEALAKAIAPLKQHPEYKRRWAKQVNADYVPDDQRELDAFMPAALGR
jgi:hypothetical protein